MSVNWDDFTPVNPSARGAINWDDFTPVEPKKKRNRTWGEAASDTAVQLAEGVNSIAGAIPNLVAPEGEVAGFFRDNADFWRDKQSEPIKERIAEADKAIDKAGEDGVIAQISEAAGQYFSDPVLASRFVVTNLPSMIPGMAATKLSHAAALARGASAGRAASVATTAGGGVNAALNAGGARGEAFEDIKRTLESQGYSPEQAEQMALSDSRVAAAVGAAAGFISGKTGLEGSIVGKVGAGGALKAGGRAAVAELAGEQIEEVAPKLTTNALAGEYDQRSIGKDVGRTIVETAIGSGPGAAVSGVMTGSQAGRNPDPAQSPAPQPVQSPAQSPAASAAPVQQQSAPAQTAAPAAAPDARLAQLEILAEQRDLTPVEQKEAADLLTAMSDEQADVPLTDEGKTPAADATLMDEGTTPAAEVAPEQQSQADIPQSVDATGKQASWVIKNKQTGEVILETFDPAKVQALNRDKYEAVPIADHLASLSQSAQPVSQPAQPGTTGEGAGVSRPTQVASEFWSFAKSKGFTPAQIKIGTPEHAALKAEYDALKSPESVLPPMQPQQDVNLQNRDRGRAASVVQMSEIARNPDYMRLGPSRTPDSGAPMVFAVDDQLDAIAPQNFGRQDVAVMSDGQRVPFRYAVVDASKVNPSNFADGRQNPEFNSATPGTIKALNNGRTAGLRAAHEMGTAGEYVGGLQADEGMHGIPADVIARTPNPMLVRVYSDGQNTAGMAAKSQGQGLGMSPAELARQDAPLMDSSVLSVYEPGEVTSASNRDFVRAFMGKLQGAGQDVAGMMTGDGQLSQDGRKRIQAALMQAAYGDSDIVEEMFDSTDTDIKAIGEALKTVAGQWANMRDSAKLGAINPEVDITQNLIQAIGLIRKARRDNMMVFDLVNQPDLMTGEAPDAMTVGVLRMFYSGQYMTRAVGKDKLTKSLGDYLTGAMATSADAGMFGDVVTPSDILATINPITEGQGNAETQPQESRGEPTGSGTAGRGAGEERAGRQGAGEGRTGSAEDSRSQPGPDAQAETQQQVGQGDQGAEKGDGSQAERAGTGQQAGADGQAAAADGRAAEAGGKAVSSSPEVKTLPSAGTFKSWSAAVPKIGTVNGWTLFRDTLDGVRYVLMTPFNSVGFDTEEAARAWAKDNKATKGDFNEKNKAEASDWRELSAKKAKAKLDAEIQRSIDESAPVKGEAKGLAKNGWMDAVKTRVSGWGLVDNGVDEAGRVTLVKGADLQHFYYIKDDAVDRERAMKAADAWAKADAAAKKADKPKAEKESAEQAIRNAFRALPSVTLGEFYPITVTHNGRTQQFLASQRALKKGNQPDAALTLLQVRQGRMIAGAELQELAYTYKLSGKNELTEDAARPATDGQIKRWTEAFGVDGKQSAAATDTKPVAATAEQTGAEGQSEPLLTNPTEADIIARQDAAEAAKREQEAADRAAKQQADQDEDRKRIAQASVRAADTFELGQDPLDSLTGQQSMFDAPQEPAKPSMSAQEAARYLKDFVYSLGALEGMTPGAQVRLSSPLGKSGRDTLLMEAFGLTRDQAHDINNKLDAARPRSLRTQDMQEAFSLFPSLRKMVDDAIQANAEKQKQAPSANTVFTEDAAERARARLKAKLRGQLNSGIDPEMMMDGITLAGYHIEKGARTFSAYARAMLADLGDGVKPYLKSWYMGVKYDPRAASFDGMDDAASVESANIDALTAQENNDVPSANGGVEPDRADAATEPAMGDSVQADTGGTAEEAGADGGQTAGRAGRRQQGGAGVSTRRAAARGNRGDFIVPGGNATADAANVSSGADFSERGSDIGVDGVSTDPVPTTQVDAVAETGNEKLTKQERQQAAEKVAVKPGDLDNIKATLPYLLEGQQEDVKKAEDRFAVPDGYGMLFTNGTGTGKTFTGLGVVKRLQRQGKTNTLIVVPDDKIAADWIESGEPLGLNITKLKDTQDAGKGIVITTYANLGENDALAQRKWDVVVADEAHTLMQSADGKVTGYLANLRAITHHPDGAFQRHRMLYREDIDKLREINDRIEGNTKILNNTDTMADMMASVRAENEKLQREADALAAKIRETTDAVKKEVADMQGASRARLLALSATPFAYEFTVDWANGYLFDYNEGQPQDGSSGTGSRPYNSGSNRERFFMQHFGYSMRYNKLTKPDPSKVDTGLLQRNFNGWLRKKGSLSARMLDVAADYDRRFVLVDSAIGNQIDDALNWVSESAREGENKNGFATLRDVIDQKFDYLSRRYLLEAIKATEVVPIVRKHMEMGRKVVVFHDYKKGGGFNPFNIEVPGKPPEDFPAERLPDFEAYKTALTAFREKFKSLVDAPLSQLQSPIAVFKREFPDVLLVNGDEKKADLLERYKRFQDDASGPQVMLVQSAKNKGWSGHDTTGKHQRVLINLGQPTAPTLAIQQEGRVYRTGQVTDAIQRYLNTGTNWEKWAFATTIAGRASTAENLGMGEQARALKDAFIAAFEESDAYPPGHEGEGKGGKERDKLANAAISAYDRAKTYYWATQKKNSKTKAQEGVDYFATPEPVGFKMAEWLGLRGGESSLEPSAGHGAIARWLPEISNRTAIEPSNVLRARLAMAMDTSKDRLVDGKFEDYAIVNKHDGIAMNPPFGVGGKTAIEHLAKAATHLRDGGRIVALIPTGPAADKRFDQWMYGTEERPVKPLAQVDYGMGPQDIYRGDTIKSRASFAPQGVVMRKDQSGNGFWVKVEGKTGETLVSAQSITSHARTGPRTQTVRPADGIYTVGEIRLPQVTFERAGTAAATRIVILEKQLDKDKAPNPRPPVDLTSITDIKDLFDRLEDTSMPPRAMTPEQEQAAKVEKADAKARQEEDKPKAPKAANPEAVGTVSRSGLPIVEHTTTKGKVIRGVIRTDLTKEQAQAIDPYTWKKDGGYFIREVYLKGDDTAAMSRSRPGTMTETMVRQVADTISDRWTQAPTIVVVPNMQDMRVPQGAREEDARQRAAGATGVPRGFYHRGTVYLVADGLKSVTDAAEALFHEALGHYGLRAVFGAELVPILDQIAMARPDLMKPKAIEYGKAQTLDQARQMALEASPDLRGADLESAAKRLLQRHRRQVAEEVLAEMAQTKPNLGYVKRAIAIIRTWLRKNVPAFKDMALTDAEIINSFILPARGWVERGERAMRPGGKVAFDRGAQDQTQTPAFKKWFGDSKVVDDQGKPLVVYHGTASTDITQFLPEGGGDGRWQRALEHFKNAQRKNERYGYMNFRSGSFFSPEPEYAGNYTGEGGGVMYPAYIRAENPIYFDQRTRKVTGIDPNKTPDALIMHDGGKVNEVAVIDPTQVKSAIGNNGDFDGTNPDIRFSRSSLGGTQPQQPQTPFQKLKAKALALTSPEAITSLIYELQDKNIDLKRLRDHIKELGGTITDLNDAYLGEELYHKRVAKRTEDFLSEELKPLLADLRARGLDMPTLERFLHARHAPEANRVLAERNPNAQMIDAGRIKAKQDVNALEVQLQRAKAQGTATKAIEQALDMAREELSRWTGVQAFKGTEDERLSLSGMSDAEAATFMAGLPAGQRVHLDALAARVDAMNAKTLDTLEKYGLMAKNQMDAWRNTYQHYVPLHRDEAHPDAVSHPIGQGFSTKGDAGKRRTGSNEKVTNILAHIAMQREAALTRGEKNRVAKKLYLMAAQNPDPEVWTVDKPPMSKTVDRETGFVRSSVDPTYRNKPNVVMVRIGGKDHAIVFNERNPIAVRMAQSIKSADMGDLNAFDSVMGKATRWLASVNTQYNPIFGLINFARDVQAAVLQLSTTPLAGQEKAVAANVPAALKGIYAEVRSRRAGQGRGTSQWAKLWEEMQDEGGTTGYRELFITPDERVKALTKELNALDRGQASQAAHAVVDWLSDYNETMENAVRLSAYKVALEQGMSKERAASVAKNLTVNFNRRGRQTAKLGAYYAFLNAAIQGSTRMVETLRGPMGKKIMLGGVMLGAVNTLIAMTMMGAGDDDDAWEKIPGFVKERSVIIPLGKEDYLAIPMPLGYHVLPNMGRKAVEMMMHSDPTVGAGTHIAEMLKLVLDAFNPLGGSQNMAQMAMPTPFDPALALIQNRDWTGKPIYREDSSNLDPTPGHTRTKDTASTFSKLVSEALVKISGGTDYQPGAINWTPDQIDYIIGQLTGGLGRELMKVEQTITAPFTGEELPPHKIPLAGRLYGNTRGPASESEKFYENLTKLNGVEREIKGRARDGGDYETYMADEPLADLVGLGNSAQNQISKLRQARREVVRQGLPGYQDDVKDINAQIGDVMKTVNQEVKRAKVTQAPN
jgi:hypothetical protein